MIFWRSLFDVSSVGFRLLPLFWGVYLLGEGVDVGHFSGQALVDHSVALYQWLVLEVGGDHHHFKLVATPIRGVSHVLLVVYKNRLALLWWTTYHVCGAEMASELLLQSCRGDFHT